MFAKKKKKNCAVKEYMIEITESRIKCRVRKRNKFNVRQKK